MVSHHAIRKLIGQPIRCHTPYGTFSGMVVHCTRKYLILAPHWHSLSRGSTWPPGNEIDAYRPFFGGPAMGPGGPGYPPPRPGGGWHLAIPLAAILGITAIGMQWW